MLAPVVLALLGWFTPLGGPGVSVRIGTSIMQQKSAATASTSASFAEKKEALKDCLRREAKKQTALRAQQAHSPQQAAATSLAHIHLAGHACVSPPPLFFTLPRLSPAFYCETTCFCETPPVIARPHLLLRDPTCYCETPPVIARPHLLLRDPPVITSHVSSASPRTLPPLRPSPRPVVLRSTPPSSSPWRRSSTRPTYNSSIL